MNRINRLLGSADRTSQKLVEKEENIKKIDYSRGLPIAREKFTGKLVKISPSGTSRMGVFAESGNGKTVMLKRIVSVFYDYGYRVFHACDRKNDFLDIDRSNGVSKGLIDDMSFSNYSSLARGEKRHPIPVSAFSPRFLREQYLKEKDRKHPPVKIDFFSLGFEDITEGELKSMVEASSPTQRDALNNILNRLDLDKSSFSDFYKEIEKIENNQTRKALLNRFDSLKNKNILSSRYSKDIFNDINKKVIVLSVKHYRDVIGSNLQGIEKIRLYISYSLRNLKKKIKNEGAEVPTLTFLDDPQHFIGAGERNNPVSNEIQDLIDVGARQGNIPLCFSTQRPSQIPNANSNDPYNFLGTLDKIFLGPNLDEDEWKPVLRSTNLYNKYYLQRWREKFNRMENYDFLYIDTEEHSDIYDCPIVRSLAPFCAHTG